MNFPKLLEFHTKSFDDLCAQPKIITKDVDFTYLTGVENNPVTCYHRQSNLEREVSIHQHRDRLHNLEIVGVVENKNEDFAVLLL